MRTAATTLAMILAAAALPAAAQDASPSSEAFDEAFGTEEPADASVGDYHEETLGEWRLFDAPTAEGERRVFMQKDLGPERSIEFDLQEGNGAAISLRDPDCGLGLSFPLRELGEGRATALAEKFSDMLDVDSCDARAAIPTTEELAEPLAQLEAWIAERPFPAAGSWKPERRPLTLGRGEGVGVGRYEGTVAIVYLEPEVGARGPAEVLVNIYECEGFEGRTLPVRSGEPAEAQDIALAVLEERAVACGLDPVATARLVEGLPEGLAAHKEYQASLADEGDWQSDEPYDPEES